MRIIFLDIDGVLVLPGGKLSKLHEGIVFDEENIRWLKRLLIQSGAKLVIISTRREYKPLHHMTNLLSYYGLDTYVLGKIKDGDKAQGIELYRAENSLHAAYLVIDDVPLHTTLPQLIPNARSGLKSLTDKDFAYALKVLTD